MPPPRYEGQPLARDQTQQAQWPATPASTDSGA